MESLLSDIRGCRVCASSLEHGCNPVLAAHPNSSIVIIGQAPGSVVHRTSIPWDDKSGERLRAWLEVDTDTFYNPENIALVPMAFCYPGKGKSGDLPPRPECAPLWHSQLLDRIKKVQLTILIGDYAQQYYLGNAKKKTLTDTIKNFEAYLPDFFVLPHPSPRNNIWLKKNEWFEQEVIPELRRRTKL